MRSCKELVTVTHCHQVTCTKRVYSVSVADRQSLSLIFFVKTKVLFERLHYCIVLSVSYFKIIGKSLATVLFVTILTVNFAGENHSIAAMPDFERRGPAKKST